MNKKESRIYCFLSRYCYLKGEVSNTKTPLCKHQLRMQEEEADADG